MVIKYVSQKARATHITKRERGESERERDREREAQRDRHREGELTTENVTTSTGRRNDDDVRPASASWISDGVEWGRDNGVTVTLRPTAIVERYDEDDNNDDYAARLGW